VVVPGASEAQPPSTQPAGTGLANNEAVGLGPGRGGLPDGGDDRTLHLSCLLGIPVAGPNEQPAGRLTDVIARLATDGAGAAWHPSVTGLVVDFDGQDRFAHAHQIASLSYDSARLTVDPKDLGPFERRDGEMLLARDLRSRHLIHLEGARLVRANEIELAKIGPTWHVMGVDTSSRPVVRRLLPRRFRHLVKSGRVVDWSDIEPFVAHVPTAHLQIPFRKLRRLHPAKLADLVEAASHEEGEEIIRAVGEDTELEADVFEELDLDHQVEFLRSRSDEEAAKLLSVMEPDDAVDLLTELDQDRRLPILQRLSPATQLKLRSLLSYNPETAGGLMNPDFVSVPSTSTVGEALQAVKSSPTPPQAAGVVFVTGDSGRLDSTALVVDLLRAEPSESVTAVARPDPASLPADADIHEVVRKMTDYNLAVAPVVDEEGRMLGQITVDDVLELMLPSGWRRQYGMAAPE
jgi:MgtE intracellular N domain/CBS domain